MYAKYCVHCRPLNLEPQFRGLHLGVLVHVVVGARGLDRRQAAVPVTATRRRSRRRAPACWRQGLTRGGRSGGRPRHEGEQLIGLLDQAELAPRAFASAAAAFCRGARCRRRRQLWRYPVCP